MIVENSKSCFREALHVVIALRGQLIYIPHNSIEFLCEVTMLLVIGIVNSVQKILYLVWKIACDVLKNFVGHLIGGGDVRREFLQSLGEVVRVENVVIEIPTGVHG